MISNFKIPSDSDIEERYNEKINLFRKIYGNSPIYTQIDKIKDFIITDLGLLMAAYFSIKMIEMGKFEVKISNISIPNLIKQIDFLEEVYANKILVFNS